MLKNAGFYLARLRRSSLNELAYRLKLAGIHFHAGQLARYNRIPCRIPLIALANARSLSLPVFKGVVERSSVDRILGGFRFCLNADPVLVSKCEQELGRKICPSTRSIGGQVDIRAVWEPARLQHLTLLFAWLQQNPTDPLCWRVKDFARTDILGWLTQNPFLHGPHYISAMECGLRLPVFFYALKLLDILSAAEAEIILKAIFLHAWWIEKNLSLHSSLGNHTVCEAMGLVFAGSVYRESAAGQRWFKLAVELLARELPHQVLEDGGPAEQAFGYHRFVLDVYWLSFDFIESNGLGRCEAFKPRLLAGEEFLAACSDRSGYIPMLGDYDDGHAIAPGLFPTRQAQVDSSSEFKTYDSAGYTVLRSSVDALLTFDHGPLGMAPLFNHGHADALSVTLAIAGIPFLVDSGTYRYNGVPVWRRYFKGTRAHNTVTVDGIDQATQLTGFVWGDPFTSRLVHGAQVLNERMIAASHDGYARLKEPLRHFRSVRLSPDSSWLIIDHFQGDGRHSFELNFHIHPDVSAVEEGQGWVLQRDGHAILIELQQGAFQLRRGEETPPLGWFSSAYNVKIPAPVLQLVQSGTATEVRFETRISMIPVT